MNKSFLVFPLEREGKLYSLDAGLMGVHDKPEEFCFIDSTLEHMITNYESKTRK